MLLSRRRRGWEPAVVASDHPVVQECEAFLHGRLADHLRTRRRPVPTWVLINGIAHRTLDELRGTTANEADPIEAALARAVVARVVDETELAAVQAELLVPLECSLSTEVLSPRRLVELAGRALFD